ncbi:hypothetical protein AY606_04670 [Acinetobacter sp. SFB]|uniref:hypothetical protein n=1 Tax=Acinetobacter sp. SFB TaxID=1805634 RepID=UPI0007D7D7EC|nr:hypothetical protein [Acinetobacter sp. SFB]OAL79941.1 hypothetical protein AY606_04670 [Acinetobacter sp. SFB]
MKNKKIKLTTAILFTCSFIFANNAVQAAKDAKTELHSQKVDKAAEKDSDKTQAGKSTLENSNHSASEERQTNNESGSHPSNMDINGRTHAELNHLAGRLHTISSNEILITDED